MCRIPLSSCLNASISTAVEYGSSSPNCLTIFSRTSSAARNRWLRSVIWSSGNRWGPAGACVATKAASSFNPCARSAETGNTASNPQRSDSALVKGSNSFFCSIKSTLLITRATGVLCWATRSNTKSSSSVHLVRSHKNKVRSTSFSADAAALFMARLMAFV